MKTRVSRLADKVNIDELLGENVNPLLDHLALSGHQDLAVRLAAHPGSDLVGSQIQERVRCRPTWGGGRKVGQGGIGDFLGGGGNVRTFGTREFDPTLVFLLEAVAPKGVGDFARARVDLPGVSQKGDGR